MTICSRTALLAAPVALCLVSLAAPATAAGCWASADIAAARIREMQTKLAVAALQCRFSGYDIRTDYNRFLRNGRSTLRAANGRLKAHFMAQGTAVGQRDYDRYTTALANAYGGSQISFGSCAKSSAVMAEAAMPRRNLLSLAAREIIAPTLPSPPCAVRNGVVLAAEQTIGLHTASNGRASYASYPTSPD
jgi:hypothetical protein